MLTMFRKMLRSKIGPVLFGIVIVGMAVWGIDDIFSGGGNSLVTAGNRSVSVVEFDETVKDRLSNSQALSFLAMASRSVGGPALMPL